MTSIQEHEATSVSDARAQQATAIAALARARSGYQDEHGAAYARAMATRAELTAKIADASSEQARAQADFETAFEESGFVQNDAVHAALRRKHDALTISDALAGALCKNDEGLFELAAAASDAGRAYVMEHRRARAAWAHAEAAAALAEHGPAIARAMRLLGEIPRQDSIHEDFNGRPPASAPQLRELMESRFDGILCALKAMALGGEQDTTPPDEIGAIEIKERDLLSPAQIHKTRDALYAAKP